MLPGHPPSPHRRPIRSGNNVDGVCWECDTDVLISLLCKYGCGVVSVRFPSNSIHYPGIGTRSLIRCFQAFLYPFPAAFLSSDLIPLQILTTQSICKSRLSFAYSASNASHIASRSLGTPLTHVFTLCSCLRLVLELLLSYHLSQSERLR